MMWSAKPDIIMQDILYYLLVYYVLIWICNNSQDEFKNVTGFAKGTHKI